MDINFSGEGSSTASKYRKDQLSKLEKEYRNKENVNPFSISNVGNKPDLWVETKIAGQLYEIIFSEMSGSPFNGTNNDDKIKYGAPTLNLLQFPKCSVTNKSPNKNHVLINHVIYQSPS